MIPFHHYTPREIADVIRHSVIGQDEAVQTVATVLSAHIARCMHNQAANGVLSPIQKDNVMVLGPTGTGKTESIRAVIRNLQLPIPMAVIATNTLTNAGYKGRNTTDILWDLAYDARRLINSNPGCYGAGLGIVVERDGKRVRQVNAAETEKLILELCQCGIVVLDEFDKLRFSSGNNYDAVYSKKLQFELLKLIEGTAGLGEDAFIQKINTSDILFICLGAFTDLLNPPPDRPSIGFRAGNNVVKPTNTGIPTTEQLVQFGFVEELVGRIPLRCRFSALSVNNLYKILISSAVSPLADFQRLFRETTNELVFDDSALKEVARRAYAVNTGARGLRTVLSDVLYRLCQHRT